MTVVGGNFERKEAEYPQVMQDQATQNATRLLLLAISSLSKRFVIAITDWMTFGLVASVWWLWRSILTNPTAPQIISVTGYAVFVVLVDVIRRRA